MPARKPDPAERAGYLDELADVAMSMNPAVLAAIEEHLDPDDRKVIERIIARKKGAGWRTTPATMAAHFEPTFKLWRYVVLLGERFRLAADGTSPHQIWMLPSQYGKTSMLMWGAVWLLDRDPTLRIMYLSYDADKAVEEGGRARDLVMRHSNELSFNLRSDRRARGSWRTDQGGGLYATGIGGAITGFPQDVLLLDDLLKGWQAAHSDAQRDYAWNVYRTQARLRVQSSKDPIIHAGTRWHEDDIQARMMNASIADAYADKWDVVRLPAIAEEPTPHADDPLLRQPDPLARAPGEPLEPERFPLEEVRARAAGLGSYLAAGLEQQRPGPEEGGEIKRAWFQYETNMPPHYDQCISSWDTKLKDREGGDYVVGQAWGRTGSAMWCFDQFRGTYNFVTTKVAIVLMSVRYPQITTHLIENTGNGPEVMRDLRAGMGADYEIDDEIRSQLGITDDELPRVTWVMRHGLPALVPVIVKGDKRVRVRRNLGVLEGKNVHVPDGQPWVAKLVGEAASFPTGLHDDCVDAMTQALDRLKNFGEQPPARPRRDVVSPKPSARATRAARAPRRR